jgi:hypothetical protein
MKLEMKLILGGVGIVLLFILIKGWKGAASSTAQAVVDVAGGAVIGTVQGVGDVLGIPNTDVQLCELDCAAGRTLEASAHCTAGRFAKYVWTGK